MNKIQLCNNYINELSSIKNLSKNSIKVYSSVINEFYKYKWNREGLINYMNDVKSQKANTISRKIVIVKNFLNYCYDKNKLTEKFWEELKAPRQKKLPKYLTKEEVEKIIKNSAEPYNNIYNFIYKTGLRISELYNIIDIQKNEDEYILKIAGKGNKERNLRVNEQIYFLYKKIIKKELPSIRSIQRNITKASKKAKIYKKVTVHTLRHSFAINLVNNNVPINSIQSVLGHSNLSTTGIYLKVSSDEITLE